MEEAFALDSLPCSHPIESHVGSDAHAHQMFDSISYCKGSAIIRMLAGHIGQEVFLKGIATYLKNRSYQNATSNDLWQALSQPSGVDVAVVMDSWIHEAGFPIVTAVLTADEIQLKQRPYPRHEEEQEKTCWNVPLLGKGPASSTTTDSILTARSGRVKQPSSPMTLNRDHAGYYRTEYPQGYLVSTTQSASKLSPIDKVGIITDMASLAFAGVRPIGELLSLITSFSGEKDCFVWSQIRKCAAMVLSSVSDDPQVANSFKTYIRQLIGAVKAEISWTGSAESYVRGELERNLIWLGATADDEDVLGEVKRRFALWKDGNKDSINRNLQAPIFGISVSRGGEEEYQAVKAEYIRNRTIDGREICIAAMGRTKHAAMARDFLDFSFASDENVTLQNIHFVGMALGNGTCADVMWEYVKENWDMVYDRLQINNVALNWFIDNALGSLDEPSAERDIAEFFAAKGLPELDHSVDVVRDNIKKNAASKARVRQEVPQWLRENGFLGSETSK